MPQRLTIGIVLAGSIATIAAILNGQAPPPASALSFLSRDGVRSLPTTTIEGQEMVALDDLAGVFQLSVREDTLAGAVTVSFNERTIVLTPGQSLASVAGRLVSLPSPLTKSGERWYVPVEFINRALALISNEPLELRKASRLVIAGKLRVPRIVSRLEQSAETTRIVLESSPKTSSTITQDGSRLLIKFDADALDAQLPAPPAQSLASSLSIADPANTVAIGLSPRFASFRATSLPPNAGVGRVVIDLLSAEVGAMPMPSPSASEESPLAIEGGPAVRTIVIDPGHGGEDAGVKGLGGTLEKDVALSVARRLKGLLEARLGVRVLLTRDADRVVRLDERAAIANNNKADLFLSLHANASLRSTLKGAEVYSLSLDRYGDEARRTAASDRQVLPVFGGGERDIEIVPWELAQSRHVEQSAALASILETSLRARVPMAGHAVQQAPLRVLVGANMPAVLVEMGYLSSREQERALVSSEFQSAMAQALFDGVLQYRDARDREVAPVPALPGRAPAALQP